ncbi:FAD-binding oxidoreductase [Pseudomonas qingdaonensis]|nr:FAD-binding oxidoreductase [Pseudomonas qingdaonensis]
MASTATKQHYDVVIVGGAVNGSATAYFLASNPDFTGSVLVVERDWTYAQSATALSSSSIRVQFSNPINIQISRFGAQFIRDFPELMAVNGDRPDLAFKENGYLFLADQKGFDVLKRLHQTQLDNGADVTLLDTEALIRRFRGSTPTAWPAAPMARGTRAGSTTTDHERLSQKGPQPGRGVCRERSGPGAARG